MALDSEARSARSLTQHGWPARVSGMGAANARHATEQLLASGVRRVLVWGTAGGLDPTLQAGTLLLPDVITHAENHNQYEVSAPFHAELETALTKLDIPLVHRGKLVSTSEPLATPREKTQVAQATGASMVDMEAAAVAEAVAQAGAEFAVLRVLLDAADVSLPPAVLTAVETPHPHLGVIIGLLKRPQDLPAVMRLGQSFRYAHLSLVTAAQALAKSEVA